MKKIPTALFLSTLAGLSLGIAGTAQAQTAARFSTVEFKDTTLNDALEMIFQAANNPAHTIDPSASLVPIGSITLQNIQWDAALRNLANTNNFKVSRGADGSYLVEPREPLLQDGLEGGFSGGSGFPGRGGFPGSSSSPGAAPFNPFGGGGRTSGSGRSRGGAPSVRDNFNFEVVPSVSTQANAQTRARVGGNNTGTDNNEDLPVSLIPVNHIYAGGIAQLFSGSNIIGTQQFVSPASSGGFGGGGIGFGGGFGGGGFGGGGFGGGGFGGGGFGGGGFGGNQFGGGGFGGNQFGGGGFGGNQFGGGGFGGNQFGGGFGGNQFGGGGFGFGF